MATHKNRIKIRGFWRSEKQALFFKKPYSKYFPTQIEVLINPDYHSYIEGIKNNSPLTIYGFISASSNPLSSHILVQSIVPHSTKQGFKHFCRGEVEIDAVAWHHDKNNPSFLLEGICNNKTVYFQMPLTHSRWAKNDPKYLLGSKLTLIVNDFNIFSPNANNTHVFPVVNEIASIISKEELNKPKLLPANQAGMVYELNKTSTVTHIKTRKVSPKLRREVFARDAWTCQECGISPEKSKNVFLEVDHIIPFSRGGTNHIDNLQTLCSICNAAKSDDKPKHLILQRQPA